MKASSQYCQICWIERRQSIEALYLILGDPFCKSCAEQNFTQEVLDTATRLVEPVIGTPSKPPTLIVEDHTRKESTEMPRKAKEYKPCRGENCKQVVGEKSTIGLCRNCYAKQLYRKKHLQAGQRVAPPQHEKVHKAAPLAFVANVPAPPAPAEFETAITIPLRVLDAWWYRLTPEFKAQAFGAFLEKTA